MDVKFWDVHAQDVEWIVPYDHVYDKGKWFVGGKINIAYNCVDRHNPETTAIIWEDEQETTIRKITYGELKKEVGRCANVLISLGIQKGDRVIIHMPMIPQAIVAMLACVRIGAIHCVVFSAFSAKSLRERIEQCNASLVITADAYRHNGKIHNLLEKVKSINPPQCLVVNHLNTLSESPASSYISYEKAMQKATSDSRIEPMGSDDPSFILYTSGSTGVPKGIIHGTGGYLVHVSATFRDVFGYTKGEVHYCTADIGWITGHSYVVYGPLSAGGTILIQEGTPLNPDPHRCARMVRRYAVSVFYTSPTLIRLLRKHDAPPLSPSLKVLGSVGETLDASSWEWYHTEVGERRCPIVDTWWQTETGAIILSPDRCDRSTQMPASVGRAFGGVDVDVIHTSGESVKSQNQGDLVIRDSWPGRALSIYGDHDRFIQTYFSKYPGYYYCADKAYRDEKGNFYVWGRGDDCINSSAHLLSAAQIEQVIQTNRSIIEVAVVGYPHPIKGEGIHAFIVIKGVYTPVMEQSIRLAVIDKIGPFALPDHIEVVEDLPKTRSGKIMRRMLRCIVANQPDLLGDVSTLANPHVIEQLLNRRNKQNI